MTMKKANYVQPTQPIVKKRITNVLTYLFIQFSFIISCYCVCFAADGDYAKSGAEWILDQLFWVALVCVIYVMLKLFIARNFVAGLVTLLVGGIVCFFIKYPETISTIGEVAAKAMGLQ